MSLRILARELRAALEPLFALGKPPHRSNRQKVKSTCPFRVCQVVALRWDVAVCSMPCVLRNAGRRLSPDAGVVRWLVGGHSAAAWPRFAAGVDIVFEGPPPRVGQYMPSADVDRHNTTMLPTGGMRVDEQRRAKSKEARRTHRPLAATAPGGDHQGGHRARRAEGAGRSQNWRLEVSTGSLRLVRRIRARCGRRRIASWGT
jgi:hypothetical protein